MALPLFIPAIFSGSAGGGTALVDPGNFTGWRATNTSPTAADSGLALTTIGDVEEILNTSDFDRGDWMTGQKNNTLFEAQVTVTGDALYSGSDSTGVYLDLTSERRWWIRNQSASTTKNSTLTVTIRRKSNPSDSISFTATLEAESFPP